MPNRYTVTKYVKKDLIQVQELPNVEYNTGLIIIIIILCFYLHLVNTERYLKVPV